MVIEYVVSVLLAPLLALALFFYYRFKSGRGSTSHMVQSFIYGIFSIILVLVLQKIANYYDWDNFRNLRRIVFYSFVIWGLGSEYGKFIVLRYYAFYRKDFIGPLDSIAYSVMISLGFAFIGNLLYFTLPIYKEVSVDFFYTTTVIFANIVFAIVMGFFVGLAKTRENRFVDSMTGLFAASFFHALYNFCFLTQDFRLLLFLAIGALVVLFLLLYKAVRIHDEYLRVRNQ